MNKSKKVCICVSRCVR